MANVKISALPSATTPVDVASVIPLSEWDGAAFDPTAKITIDELKTAVSADLNTTASTNGGGYNVVSDSISVASDSAIYFELSAIMSVVSGSSTRGDSQGMTVKGVIKNLAGTTSIVGTNTTTVVSTDAAIGYDVIAVANDTTDTLEIQVQGYSTGAVDFAINVKYTVVNF
jgi:hypothetical protein